MLNENIKVVERFVMVMFVMLYKLVLHLSLCMEYLNVRVGVLFLQFVNPCLCCNRRFYYVINVE